MAGDTHGVSSLPVYRDRLQPRRAGPSRSRDTTGGRRPPSTRVAIGTGSVQPVDERPGRDKDAAGGDARKRTDLVSTRPLVHTSVKPPVPVIILIQRTLDVSVQQQSQAGSCVEQASCASARAWSVQHWHVCRHRLESTVVATAWSSGCPLVYPYTVGRVLHEVYASCRYRCRLSPWWWRRYSTRKEWLLWNSMSDSAFFFSATVVKRTTTADMFVYKNKQ